MGKGLGHGFLFHVTDRSGNITTNPFVGLAVANRLEKHFSNLKLNNAEFQKWMLSHFEAPC